MRQDASWMAWGWRAAAAALWLTTSMLCAALGQVQNPEVPPTLAAEPAPSVAGPVVPVPVVSKSGPQDVKIPARPEDPRGAKTYAVFETHCARCHQAGKTELPLAAGGLSNILAIDELPRDPQSVRPGIPDASRIYDILVTRHAPLDVFTGQSDGNEPTPDDIESVRDWIKELKSGTDGCTERTPVRPSNVEALVRDALKIEREGAKDFRFISLAHLYNACATAAEMSSYRQALIKLLNGLSWSPEPAKLMPLDAAGTVLALKLSDFGWVAGHWELIQRAYPKPLLRPISDDVKKSAGAAIPLVNGDWLAAAASEPPLYYALLGLPQKLSELAKMNAVDIDQNIKSAGARRAVVRTSEITRGNRLVERHPGGRGGFWMVYDFATSTGDQDLFERPLGPRPSNVMKTPFKPDSIRTFFALPNGFLAFVLFDAAGNRIDRVLPGIEKPFDGSDGAALDPATKSGANCMACHNSGVVAPKDELRSYATSATSTLPADVRDAALALTSSDSETVLLASGDNDRYRQALTAAGVDPALMIESEEIVSGLARRYRGDIELKVAAAEAGLDRDAFVSALISAPGAAAALARRLQQGALPRAELDKLATLLLGAAVPPTVAAPGGFLRDIKTEIGLSVWIDKPLPAAGDLVTVKAEPDTDCFLTVISVDAQGKATVLFPNDFEADNLVSAGATHSIPGPDAPYQLRFKADGTETLMARCSTSAVPPTGIEYDFERQRFTVLGNWENFIQDTLVTDAELRRNPEKAERARSAKAQALRRRQARGERVEERLGTSPSKALRDGRAVVVIGKS
jgi:mono/diheme cytochrome c family protein